MILDLAHAADVVFENFRPAGAPSDSTFFFSFVYDTLGVPLAAGLFAVSQGPAYYSSELKPYAVDVAATIFLLAAMSGEIICWLFWMASW